MNESYIRALQEMANDFLSKNGKMTIKDMLANEGKEEIPSELTPRHKLVLQEMVSAYIKSQGKDVETELGHPQVLTALSKEEIPYLDELLSLYTSSKEKKNNVL